MQKVNTNLIILSIFYYTTSAIAYAGPGKSEEKGSVSEVIDQSKTSFNNAEEELPFPEDLLNAARLALEPDQSIDPSISTIDLTEAKNPEKSIIKAIDKFTAEATNEELQISAEMEIRSFKDVSTRIFERYLSTPTLVKLTRTPSPTLKDSLLYVKHEDIQFLVEI